jgi:hypothetical protein
VLSVAWLALSAAAVAAGPEFCWKRSAIVFLLDELKPSSGSRSSEMMFVPLVRTAAPAPSVEVQAAA